MGGTTLEILGGGGGFFGVSRFIHPRYRARLAYLSQHPTHMARVGRDTHGQERVRLESLAAFHIPISSLVHVVKAYDQTFRGEVRWSRRATSRARLVGTHAIFNPTSGWCTADSGKKLDGVAESSRHGAEFLPDGVTLACRTMADNPDGAERPVFRDSGMPPERIRWPVNWNMWDWIGLCPENIVVMETLPGAAGVTHLIDVRSWSVVYSLPGPTDAACLLPDAPTTPNSKRWVRWISTTPQQLTIHDLHSGAQLHLVATPGLEGYLLDFASLSATNSGTVVCRPPTGVYFLVNCETGRGGGWPTNFGAHQVPDFVVALPLENLVVVSDGNAVWVCDGTYGRLARTLINNRGVDVPLISNIVALRHDVVAVANANNEISLWHASTGDLHLTLNLPRAGWLSLTFEHGHFVTVSDADSRMRVWV